MAATADMIARLRRMVDEPDAEPDCTPASGLTYTDDDLADFIERYPLLDERGVAPYYYDTSTDPPTQVATVGWYPTYDLNAAAAEIWGEKASAVADSIDAVDENGTTPKSQRSVHYRQRERYYLARRAAKTAMLVPYPRGSGRDIPAWLGNTNDPYE